MEGANTPEGWLGSDGWKGVGKWIEADDGCRLFVRRWYPQGISPSKSGDKPRGILHIIHGMAEHSLRYERLARRLCEEGIEVWVADQRGHGKTADLGVNGRGKGGLLGHCADKDGVSRVTADIRCLNGIIQETYPGTPLFLMGHSWGSFVAQNYIENFGGLSGCILSGTRGPGGLKIALGALLMALLALLQGNRKGAFFSRLIVDGSVNKPFKPGRTVFDWLSRDEQEVDAFIADPLCGYLCSAGFYRDMIGILRRIHKPEAMAGISGDLPIYVFCGSADPAGDMGSSPTALMNAYRSLGIKDLEFVLYPDARHETLNETNREEVTENLRSWILRHCGK
ncbi:MAG: lysophospholipase [Treponema sp.]|jgi:alpha-beta hydrolase superfamily lysophospholipase|nr:lysophospholipase [Treponema sp.]